MKIISIKWRNFNSYGNSFTEFDFKEQRSLNLLYGRNGSGKSSFLAAVSFALYGSVPNKKTPSLPNLINGNLEVDLLFESKGHQIRVRRCIKPNKFEVWIDGRDDIIGDLSNKKQIQSTLQTYIGIPQKIFHNIVSLDISKFISFLKLSPADKRSIIDNIFNLDIINIMSENHKATIKSSKNSIREVEMKIEWNFNEIKKIQQSIQTLLDKRDDDILAKNAKLQEELVSLESELSSINDKVTTITDKKTACVQKIQEFESAKVEYSIEIRNNRKKISEIDKDTCPVCGNDLTTDYYSELKENLANESKSFFKKSESCDVKIGKLTEKLNKINLALRECRESISSIRDKQTEVKMSIKQVDTETKVKIETLEGKIDDYKNAIETSELQLVDLKVKMSLQMQISEILSESGFKRVVIGNLMPKFNKQIDYFRKVLEIPHNINFDEDFKVNIMLDGSEFDLNSLSVGETKKLDLSVIFSLLMLIKMQYKNLNILFLDEVFAGLDIPSQNQVVEILRKICDKLDLHIFVIHHAEMERNNFDKIISVEKRNKFSHMEVANLVV